jgi:hypothetical protein
MASVVYGIALILIGSVYLWKPTIFRRGVWMKTSIAIRTLSETNYTRYMRGLGVVCIAVGVVLILSSVFR